MNLKKKMRRGSLAALITLALASSALAMPTGGEVVRGAGDITISGGTWQNVENNATITAKNDGTINWQTFNIAEGETLKFNIADHKTLVNQVVGSQISNLLGTMQQTGTGKGNVVLVNPNGIHVGAKAVLNVSDLTLSALSIGEATDTKRILTAKAEGRINVENGARFTANELSLIGRKVEVADGVVFDIGATAGTDKSFMQVIAADHAEWTFDGKKMLTKNITHNAGNDIVFNGTVNMKGGKKSLVEIGGAKASVTGAKFHGDRLDTTIYAASKFELDERDANRDNHSYTATTTKDNTVTADKISAAGKSLSLGGGVVTVKNSTAKVDTLSIEALSSYKGKGDGKLIGTATADNTVRMENVKADVREFDVVGGKVEAYNGTTVNASEELKKFDVKRTDGSEAVYQRDASSHILAKGEEASVFTVVDKKPGQTEPEQPKKPEQPKPVPTPELSKDDKANMASGKKTVEEALSKNASQENRIAALTDVVADLNENASRRQSAGVVGGMVQEIATSAALSDGEKASLVESVLSAYTPVQEAKAAQDNTATNTVDEAVNVATNVSVAPIYPDDSEAEEVVSFT